MRQLAVGSSALLLALADPSVAGAQACLGVPSGSRSAIVGSVTFPESATEFGAAGVAGIADDVYGVAHVSIKSFDDDIVEIDNQTTVGGKLYHQIPSLAATASVCPTVGVNYSTVDSFNMLNVPLGVSVGTTLPLGSGSTTLTPYVEPQFIWSRFTLDGFDESETDTVFGTSAGATIGLGQFLVGASVGKVFEERSDAVFSFLAGVTF